MEGHRKRSGGGSRVGEQGQSLPAVRAKRGVLGGPCIENYSPVRRGLLAAMREGVETPEEGNVEEEEKGKESRKRGKGGKVLSTK